MSKNSRKLPYVEISGNINMGQGSGILTWPTVQHDYGDGIGLLGEECDKMYRKFVVVILYCRCEVRECIHTFLASSPGLR